MENITLGFAMCGSFCTFDPVLTALEALKAQYPDIIPILSPASASTDTRFGTAAHFRSRLEAICGHDVWDTIEQVEPIGPKKLLDALIVAPRHWQYARQARLRHRGYAGHAGRQGASAQ